MTLRSGDLAHRVRIERRGVVADDGLGNVLEGWVAVATRWASWRPRFGSKPLVADRPEDNATGTLGLRRDPVTEAITAADRLVFVAGPVSRASTDEAKTARIVSITPLDDTIEIAVITGVST